MTWLEALILGLVQGLTEFLPVSSSGHLEIGSVLLGLESNENLLFAVVVHLATALSTMVVYRRDIGTILYELFQFKINESLRFTLTIFISMVPVLIVGLFFQDEVEQFFSGNLVLVGTMLLVTAALLLLSHYYKSGEKEVDGIRALVIGLAQAIAVLPGVSRSGATISTALLLGVERKKAARFSFLMVIIPILGAAVLKLKDFIDSPAADVSAGPLVIGFLAAFISGILACRWMVRLVTKGGLIFFAMYCAIIGLIAIVSQVI